jgi:hypothetical protein
MLWILLACVKEDPQDSGDTADTNAQCGSTQGFVSGTVTWFGEALPEPVNVIAWPDGGGDTLTALTDASGAYELNLEAGSWSVHASTSGDEEYCSSERQTLAVVECEEQVADFDVTDCETADKPNLYLYPERDTPTVVQLELDPHQRVVASAPEVQDLSWRGVARPDGTWEQGGEIWPFLFYEVTLLPEHSKGLQGERGWCVGPDRAPHAMAEHLRGLGFNEREAQDFVDAWIEDLPAAPGYAVFPLTEVDAIAGVHIEPALPLSRVWLVVEPAQDCVLEAPDVAPMDRSGPHAVEWGVVLRGF